MYHLFVLNHGNSLIEPRLFQSFRERDKAVKTALKILKTIAQDYKESLYVFMENKEMEIEGMMLIGLHLYSGNVPWSCFIENAEVEGGKMGPFCKDLDIVSNTNYEA